MAIALMAACAPRAEEPDAASPPLASTLQVGVEAESVVFDLHVTNGAAEAVVLEFPTAQRYDFVVETLAGEPVWRWSEGRGFAQVVGRETIEPGGTLHFRAAWNPPASLSGTYRARGMITTAEPRIELSEEFELRR